MSVTERTVIKRSKKPKIAFLPGDNANGIVRPSGLADVLARASDSLVTARRAIEKMDGVPAEPRRPRIIMDMPIEEKVIAFIETLKVPDGPDVGKLIVLRDWQKVMIRQVYGPRRVNDKGDDVRAIRQAIWTLARKNGKTSMAGGLILAHLTGPCAIWNGQLFSVAFEVGQAALAFRVVQSMVLQDEDLSRRVIPTESSKRALCLQSNSVFRALSSESRSKHGLNPNFVLFDEFSQFGTDRALFDVMTTSMGAQKEPLALVISTQAAEDAAVLSELVDYGEAVNKGEIKDETFHLTKYAMPAEMDPFDESKWHLANPALGDFRSLDEMRQYAARARMLPTMMNSFRNLYLNQRVAMSSTFVDEVTWARCAGEIDFNALEGRTCTAGLDLSSKVDLTALVLVFDDPPYEIVPFFWTPKNTLSERTKRDRVPYEKWAEGGYIEAVPGNAIDFRFVTQRLAELSAIFNIRAIGFDRWRIDVLRTWMDEFGVDINMIPIGQGFKDGTLMVETVENALLNVGIKHDNHPVLSWNAKSVQVIRDPAGNRKFDKTSRTQRIDGFVALAMGLRVKELLVDDVMRESPILVF
jgi:phage terminase large subunit-like protein